MHFTGSSHWAPEFLEPVILEVVLAGKSMEMLQDLGKLADVCGGKQGRNFYEYLMHSIPSHEVSNYKLNNFFPFIGYGWEDTFSLSSKQ